MTKKKRTTKLKDLQKTNRTVKVVRVGVRRIYKDSRGQLWVRCFKKWWKFPQEVEY